MREPLSEGELAPMLAWMHASQADLVELSRLTGEWAHLHTEVMSSQGIDDPGAATLAIFSGPAMLALFDLAYALRSVPQRAEYELCQLALALVPMVDVPPFTMTASKGKGCKAHASATTLSTKLICSARAAAAVTRAAFSAVDVPPSEVPLG